MKMKVKVAQLSLTLCNPMDYTVHGILQARILEWVAFPFSRGSSQSRSPALQADSLPAEKMPATVEAAQLQKWNEEGVITGCIVEGPIALDVALSKRAADHKKIESRIAGETDLFVMPDIEAGNLVGKTLMFLAGAKMAGIILGAKCPIVLVSRSDNAEAKVNSLAFALACL